MNNKEFNRGFSDTEARNMGAAWDGSRAYYVGGSTRKWYPIYKFANGRIAYRNGAGMFYPCTMRNNIKRCKAGETFVFNPTFFIHGLT